MEREDVSADSICAFCFEMRRGNMHLDGVVGWIGLLRGSHKCGAKKKEKDGDELSHGYPSEEHRKL